MTEALQRFVALIFVTVAQRRLDGLQRLSGLGQAGDFGLELPAPRLGPGTPGRFVLKAALKVGDLGGAKVHQVTRLGQLTSRRLPLGIALGEHGLDFRQQAGLLPLHAPKLR